MRLIVTSDTHRDFHSLRRLVEMHRASADIFIHLGDGAQELEQAIALYPDCKWLSVRGNCDFGTSATLAGCFSCGPAKIFYTHGHMYSVKYGLDDLVAAAADIEANVLLFGHTHVPFVGYQRGMHLLNPGSLGLPRDGKSTYGVVDVTETDIVCFINELDNRRK
ncbi:MAG: metallophosphoesterase family protein [Anaerotruncus massiliensis (ex Togo et al. 2019)]